MYRTGLARSVAALTMLGSSSVAVLGQSGDSTHSGAVFRGHVVDRTNRSPIPGADVWLIESDRHATTDSAGAFRFDRVARDVELVQVRRLGFAVRRDTVRLAPDRETERTYSLVSQSTTLPTVHTTAAQTYSSPRLQAFEERRLSAVGGHFIGDSVLRRNENSTLANVVEGRIPGLTAVRGRVLVSTRKQCRGLALSGSGGRSAGAWRESQCPPSPNCYISIYLDGAMYYTASMAGDGVPPPDLSRDINVSDLTGAEFYADGASAPAGMHSNDDGCGSLWLWTREK